MFKPFDGQVDYPEMEHRILRFWDECDIFRKLMEKNRDSKAFSFIDGPITANNPQGMGVHHAWGRTYKDVYIRFRAMEGCDQRYQNGFDCQGLWVEVEVEKDLGLNCKRDILDYGLERFCTTCRERVEVCSQAVVEKSKRLGQWMDWENSYFTFSDTNIEHIWHFLKRCHEEDWLYKGHRSMPWCVRCGTSLSQHELIDAYRELTHPSVFMKLPLLDRDREHLLVWTTTPWTLTANTACAVHPELIYAKVRQGEDVLYLSEQTTECLAGDYEKLTSLPGRELVGLRYAGPFHDLPAQASVQSRVVPWELVGEEEGTGIVHIAPGCGAEDFALSQEEGLDVLVPIDDDGYLLPEFGWLAGKHVAEVAQPIFDDLARKGFLYKTEDYTHRYPVCWRCGEELVFKLVDEWFIACDEIRPRMIRAARTVRWIPEHSGKRMEDWLNNMGDWCISRKRFWGLPLPFYECACGQMTVVGTRKELEALAAEGIENLPELHKPWIDGVRIRCPKCGETVSRIPEVGDCWLDAGIVPFSTLGYLDEDKSYWQKWFPADFITEMREQIRLWFYSQLFMSVTLENCAPYRTVMTYEKMNDEHGQPMHKSAGNAIWFDEAAERMGADVMRWIFAKQNLSANLNFGYHAAEEVKRQMMTLWNVVAFFVQYANLDRPQLSLDHELQSAPRTDLDRWILARLNQLVASCQTNLENYQLAPVTHDIEEFVEELSKWYVRRNRRRFWKNENDADKAAAYQTLYYCLITLSKLLAPILPFTAEELHQTLVRPIHPKSPESVHLAEYPSPTPVLDDEALVADMSAAMRIISLGRAARTAAQLKVRQPLRRLLVYPATRHEREVLLRFKDQILEELNVKELEVPGSVRELMAFTVKPAFSKLGPKYGPRVAAIVQAIEAADLEALGDCVVRGQPFELQTSEGVIPLQPEEVVASLTWRPGLSVAREGETTVAVDTAVGDSLLREGMARDMVRHIQSMRKEAGYSVSDRIRTCYLTSGELAEALVEHSAYIKQETLSVELVEGRNGDQNCFESTFEVHEIPVTVGVARIPT